MAWKTIEEKMPPLNTEVFMKTNCGHYTVGMFENLSDEEFRLVFHEENMYGWYEMSEVKKWMPIPEE